MKIAWTGDGPWRALGRGLAVQARRKGSAWTGDGPWRAVEHHLAVQANFIYASLLLPTLSPSFFPPAPQFHSLNPSFSFHANPALIALLCNTQYHNNLHRIEVPEIGHFYSTYQPIIQQLTRQPCKESSSSRNGHVRRGRQKITERCFLRSTRGTEGNEKARY